MLRAALSVALLSSGSACGGLVRAAPGASLDADSASPRDVVVDSAPVAFDAGRFASCPACLAAACTDLLVQCEQSTACSSLLACARGADADECECRGTGDGAGPFLATERCLEEEACKGVSCAALCSTPDSGGPRCSPSSLTTSCTARPTSSTRACEACVTASCGELASACGTDCEAYVRCLESCESPGCQADCSAMHAEGATGAEALDVCLGSACAAECDF